MFDKNKRNGLGERLLKRAGFSEDSSTALLAVAPVATANYPRGAEIAILPPRLNVPAVNQVTNDYLVGRGVRDLDNLYRCIWGLDREEYEDAALQRLRSR